MLPELMRVTPWWVWMLVVLGAVLIFGLAVVLPTVLVAKGTPRGSRERSFVYKLGGCGAALTLASCALCLMDPARQMIYSSLLLFALLLSAPWVHQKLKKVRETDQQKPPNQPPARTQ
ncbi:MAG: hypothetical protein NTY53_25630 [Kiritimatiellaeota bacterium]|nr:hypothetical protein [Kiritimatiellota bacterium]